MSAASWFHDLRTLDPTTADLFLAADQSAFVEAVEAAIFRVLRRFERARSTYRKLQERDLSRVLVDMLGPMVPATAETDSNGHADVFVSDPLHRGFGHVTECKIWDGEAYHRGGMTQVLDYANGHEARVMVLAFFIEHKRMHFLFERVRGVLIDGPPDPTGESSDLSSWPGAFVTYHAHKSGRPLAIAHVCCDLFEA